MGDLESNDTNVFDREPPHGGGRGGAGPQLLGDVEAALAAVKGSAVFDREPQTVDAMERLTMARMAVTNAKMEELRAELDEGRSAIKPPGPVCFTCRESLHVYE